MARNGKLLTDRSVQPFLQAYKRGNAEQRKLFDSGGLYLTHTEAGNPVWRLKYRVGGKERTYTIGGYPAVSIAQARAERDHAKSLLRVGNDPVQARNAVRQAAIRAEEETVAEAQAQATTFRTVVEGWLAFRARSSAWSAGQATRARRALERHVLPRLGEHPVRDITPEMISAVVTEMITKGLGRTVGSTASKVREHLGAIFRYARANGDYPRDRDNPAEAAHELVRQATSGGVVQSHAAVLNVEGLRGILQRADAVVAAPATRLASRLCAASSARIENIVSAEWHELDLDGEVPTWTIARAKMKVKKRKHDHRIVLGPTIAAELRAWRDRPGGGGGTGWVFPASRKSKSGHITKEGVDKFYSETLQLKDKHSPHGWRAAFSTLAKEAPERFDAVAVDLVLDHVAKSEVARAYDRGERLMERVRIAAWWDRQLFDSAPAARPSGVLSFRRLPIDNGQRANWRVARRGEANEVRQ